MGVESNVRALAVLALSTVSALLALTPGPVAADQRVTGTVVAIVQDGGPASPRAGSEFLAVRTPDGLVPLEEGASAPDGARVTGSVDASSGEFSLHTVSPSRTSANQLVPRVQSVIVVQAQWVNERRVVGDAIETARVIEETVAPYWSNVTEGRLQLVVEQALSVTIDAPKPKDCSFNSLLDPVEAATGLHGGVGTHLVVVTEKEDCWWAGMAVIPGDVTQAGGEIVLNGYGTNESVIAHEFGHNFSLKHAGSQSCTDAAGHSVVDSEQCTVDQYGDLYDVMGAYSLGVISPVMLAQLQSLDLLDPAVDNLENGSALHTLASRWSTSGTRALEVSDGTNAYWLEYRPSTPDENEPSAWCGSGVIVRRVEPSTTSRTYASRLLLPDGWSRGLLPGQV